MHWETLSCAEVKEPVGTVVAQSARVCRDLLKNQCSVEPMVNRCAPGVFYRDHIGCVVLAWTPSGTARSHTLLNLERALQAQTIRSCFLAFRSPPGELQISIFRQSDPSSHAHA